MWSSNEPALPDAFTNTQPSHSATGSPNSVYSRDVEALGRVEAGRGAQRAVEVVDPRVVRARDRRPLVRLAARQQLVAAVTAHVRERVQLTRLAADEEHTFVADAHCGARPGFRDLGRTSGAHPRAREEVVLLPGEHRRIRVRATRQHLPGSPRIEHGLHLVERQRRCRVDGEAHLPSPPRSPPTERVAAVAGRPAAARLNRLSLRSARMRLLARYAGMPVTPPPACVADEHW